MKKYVCSVCRATAVVVNTNKTGTGVYARFECGRQASSLDGVKRDIRACPSANGASSPMMVEELSAAQERPIC